MIFISALWLGILASISPCPLASNIEAVSFLSKKITRPKIVLSTGMAYTLGRMISYALVGSIIVMSLVSVPIVANFLQKYMNRIMGPILLIVGFFLLDIIRFNIPRISCSQRTKESMANSGAKGAFTLGVIFALSFCPISAALFFGSLIPMALNNSCGIALPFIYGLGTGLPVVVFSLGIALGVKSFSYWFSKVKQFEPYARKVTGGIFILVGLYYIWAYILVGMF
ncbi:MAG: sulfite exporter TauE/SafE family protein [Candidatus Omnitrophica bacterium]|nr:sulfite exporter TauE/SafE family protein [Candidatus Omnitrophota bacterium]MBU4590396.1 sulfite exporter TauE/SafE family protein [Candidatus Omnitrophota bacterium]